MLFIGGPKGGISIYWDGGCSTNIKGYEDQK